MLTVKTFGPIPDTAFLFEKFCSHGVLMTRQKFSGDPTPFMRTMSHYLAHLRRNTNGRLWASTNFAILSMVRLSKGLVIMITVQWTGVSVKEIVDEILEGEENCLDVKAHWEGRASSVSLET